MLFRVRLSIYTYRQSNLKQYPLTKILEYYLLISENGFLNSTAPPLILPKKKPTTVKILWPTSVVVYHFTLCLVRDSYNLAANVQCCDIEHIILYYRRSIVYIDESPSCLIGLYIINHIHCTYNFCTLKTSRNNVSVIMTRGSVAGQDPDVIVVPRVYILYNGFDCDSSPPPP